jgi:hypothetical protein
LTLQDVDCSHVSRLIYFEAGDRILGQEDILGQGPLCRDLASPLLSGGREGLELGDHGVGRQGIRVGHVGALLILLYPNRPTLSSKMWLTA